MVSSRCVCTHPIDLCFVLVVVPDRNGGAMTPVEKKLILWGISLGVALVMIQWYDRQFKETDWFDNEEGWWV